MRKLIDYPGYNFSLLHIPEVINVALPLHEDSCAKFITYVRIYNDGTVFNLITSKNWMTNFYEKYLDQNHTEGSKQSSRLVPGINYWKRSKSIELSEVDEDARNNFDMDARIEFVYWDEVLQCHHIYAFYANCKNADKAYIFYDIHRAKLLKFISYFNKNMYQLMLEGHKIENRTQIPDYTVRKTNNNGIKKDYALELQQENKNTQLSDREFEILILFANGLTVKQIAKMLSRSNATIETHLLHLKQKIDCNDRREMQIYIRDRGYEGLEKFFFSYITEPELLSV